MAVKNNKHKIWQNYKLPRFWLGLVSLIIAVALLLIPKASLDGDFSITFIDVGQGDAIFIQSGEYNILLDGGGTPFNVTGAGKNIVVPFLQAQGVKKLDMVINSHPDADHIGGLFPVLEQIAVDELLMFENYQDIQLQQKLEALADNKNIPISYTYGGLEYKFGDDLIIAVICPTESESFNKDRVNEGSLVLKISYGDFDVLTVGDLQGREQKMLIDKMKNAKADIADFADIEVLQIPHHGSKYSYLEDWYSNFTPDYTVISVGKNNSYGHPFQGVVEYWQRLKSKVLRTDLDGSISFIWNNGQVNCVTAK